jgi:putative heme-binding domain-containing protein
VRAAAIAAMPAMPIPDAAKVEHLTGAIGRGSVAESQGAIAALGSIKTAPSAAALARLADQIASGALDASLQLDVLEAMRASGEPALASRLEQIGAGRGLEHVATAFPAALRAGGSPARGLDVVTRHPAAQCTRCHTVADSTATVGPNLKTIGAQLPREELLAALLTPSSRVAPGYGQVSVTLRNGRTVQGVLKEDTAAGVAIEVAPDNVERIPAADIASRTNAVSAMPPMGSLLSPREIRDVVEFLASQR